MLAICKLNHFKDALCINHSTIFWLLSLIVCLISVCEIHCTIKTLKYLFHNPKYYIFSWCTKLNLKDTKPKNGRHRNRAHRTDILLRLAFNENDRSITHFYGNLVRSPKKLHTAALVCVCISGAQRAGAAGPGVRQGDGGR